MYVERKFDYTPGHKGRHWASELNMVVDELINCFSMFSTPSKSNSKQLVSGINNLGMMNMWTIDFTDSSDSTFLRMSGLATPTYLVGLSGTFMVKGTNHATELRAKFLGKMLLPFRRYDAEIIPYEMMEGELYKFVILNDDDGNPFFAIFNDSIRGAVEIVSTAGQMVTTDPLPINVDGSINLSIPARGDLVFNTAHLYTVDVDGNTTDAFDDVRATIDSTDPLLVQLDLSDIAFELDDRVAVVTYTR